MVTKHDMFCRCRACKPPLVGEEQNRRIAIMGLIIALAAFAGAFVALVRP